MFSWFTKQNHKPGRRAYVAYDKQANLLGSFTGAAASREKISAAYGRRLACLMHFPEKDLKQLLKQPLLELLAVNVKPCTTSKVDGRYKGKPIFSVVVTQENKRYRFSHVFSTFDEYKLGQIIVSPGLVYQPL